MEKIIALRDKFDTPSIEALETSVLKVKKLALDHFNKKQEILHEDCSKINELRAKTLQLQEKINGEENKLKSMMVDLANHNETLTELEHERSRLVVENRQTIFERNKIKTKCSVPSPKDENILDNGRKKLQFYKMVTGIRWDYPLMNSYVKGYVTNKNDYIRPFSFDLNDENVEEKLWNELMRSTGIAESI